MDTLWLHTVNLPEREQLKDDISCDAVVIGGGMCGLLTAYTLSRRGLKTVLLEADRVAKAQTAATTAKITSAHSLIYDRIENSFGEEAAKIYAYSSETAIDEYRKIVEGENIDCDFETKPAYIYSLYGERKIQREYEAASRAGLKCGVTGETGLPFSVKSAIRYENQAQFNPLKFAEGISNKINIYENSRVTEIKDGLAITEYGSVKAKNIVIATHFPHINFPGFYFIKMHREMAHVCAFKDSGAVDGMYLGIDGGYSYRNYGDYLIVAGENHLSGKGIGGAYERISEKVSSYYPDSKLCYSWSAEDCMTLDSMPYIGRFSRKSGRMFVASGFMKWGMSSSMVAATLISDMICGSENPAIDLFDPNRFNMRASFEELTATAARSFSGVTSRILSVPDEELRDVRTGEGKIVRYMGKKVGAYRDDDGQVHFVSIKCPHLGCELSWNSDDKTWDCPCHGSRFNYNGEAIFGPAENDIKINF